MCIRDSLDNEWFALKEFAEVRCVHDVAGATVVNQLSICAQDDWKLLQREARKLRRLRHPYVAAVEGVVWDRDHHLVYMMSPFYAGGSLRRLIERGAPSAPAARLLSKQVGAPPHRACCARAGDALRRVRSCCWPSSTFTAATRCTATSSPTTCFSLTTKQAMKCG